MTSALLALLPLALAAPSAPDAADEADLAREARIETLFRVALRQNPDLREARERALAAQERAAGAAALPEAELQAQAWQQPLAKPFDPKAGGMVMIGLRQTFPALGTRAARGRAARADAGGAAAAAVAREQDLLQQLRKALAEYGLAELEQLIHLDHMQLTSRFVDLARSSVQEGRISRQDFLRASAELARVHADISAVAQARRASASFLNTLLGREPGAALGPPRLLPPAETEFSVEEIEHALDLRPEVSAATRAVERSQALLDAAGRSARWPGFMLGADYGYMPMDGTKNYTLMAGITLPWLWGRRDADLREAERLAAADQAALESVRRTAVFQVREAKTRLEAARESYDILETQVLPLLRQASEASQAAFGSGETGALSLLDTNRAYLQVRLERARALARVHSALADLERAAGHLHGVTMGHEGKQP